MSNTLFRYIFKDLLRIFLLTSGALAGIMSFGGLLRPLTEHGLDAAQAAKMLSYFMPAMMTYSLPIAALFATTVVYGRLAADNELVACRAAGISFFSIGMPALVLGLTVALVSLLFLCFIVPVFTLKVERVIYSNLAQLISNEIERTHQIKFQDTTIFAQEAQVAEDDPKHPEEQVVSLGGVMIVSYEKQDSSVKDTTALLVPREFYLAKQVTIFIRRDRQDNYTLEAILETPGGAILHFAHRHMEGLTLDREVMHLRDSLIPRYSELVYNGYWFSPEREALQALVTETQRNVSGVVRLRLYKGNIIIAGRKSDRSLYDADIATMEGAASTYDQGDATGFIRINALRLKLRAALETKNDRTRGR